MIANVIPAVPSEMSCLVTDWRTDWEGFWLAQSVCSPLKMNMTSQDWRQWGCWRRRRLWASPGNWQSCRPPPGSRGRCPARGEGHTSTQWWYTWLPLSTAPVGGRGEGRGDLHCRGWPGRAWCCWCPYSACSSGRGRGRWRCSLPHPPRQDHGESSHALKFLYNLDYCLGSHFAQAV